MSPPPPADGFLIAGTTRAQLTADDPVVVPSGAVVLELHGVADAGGVRLDGRSLAGALSAAGVFTAAIDLSRATGFHHLLVDPGRRYVFGTTDAKLRIEGVVSMLDHLREHGDGGLGLAWDGVMQFSGSDTVVRDPRLDLAWLERNGLPIVETCTAISRRPFVSQRTRHVRAPHGVADVPATAALARRQRSLMQEFDRGLVEFQGTRWSPREIVRREREQVMDTLGNRRATRLLVTCLGLVYRCRATRPQDELLQRLDHDLSHLLRQQPFREIRRRRQHVRLGRALGVEERTDARYVHVRELLERLLRERHWDPTKLVAEEWAYAALADRVYQTFVGLILAQAFELKRAAPLGQTGPHFASDEYELWIDAVPPSHVLQSWRDDTSRPLHLRPDLVLRRIDGQVALLDAKYRMADDRATSDSLSEVQLYLQAFGCRHISVVFPPRSPEPPWSVEVVRGDRYGITEIPLRPHEDLLDYVRTSVRPAIERTFHSPAPRLGSDEHRRETEEAHADQVQAAAVRTLLAAGDVVRLTQPGMLRPAENNLRRTLGGTWDELSEEIQRMLITAECFGDQVPEGFDHSGPVLGIFAACERLARERFFDALEQRDAKLFSRMTFGQAGAALRGLPNGRAPRDRAARAWLQEQGMTDLTGLAACGATIQTTNRWRIAAAHAELVDKETWDDSHRAILTPASGLLASLVAALPAR